MALIRAAGRILALAGLLVSCLLAHGLTRAVRRRSLWPRRFLGGVARICGARVEITGTPLARDVLFVSNHVNWLDITIIAGATGTVFVAKSSLKSSPLIGWLCDLNATVYVDRADRANVHGQVQQVQRALERHQPVTIFPEGTTSDGVTLLPFKPALLEVVAPPPRAIKVQPLFLDYGDARGLAWVGEEPALANVRRVLTRPGSFTARLTCCEPFDPRDHGDRKGVAAEARRRILAASESLPAPV